MHSDNQINKRRRRFEKKIQVTEKTYYHTASNETRRVKLVGYTILSRTRRGNS